MFDAFEKQQGHWCRQNRLKVKWKMTNVRLRERQGPESMERRWDFMLNTREAIFFFREKAI